jgi:hypothetical protein
MMAISPQRQTSRRTKSLSHCSRAWIASPNGHGSAGLQGQPVWSSVGKGTDSVGFLLLCVEVETRDWRRDWRDRPVPTTTRGGPGKQQSQLKVRHIVLMFRQGRLAPAVWLDVCRQSQNVQPGPLQRHRSASTPLFQAQCARRKQASPKLATVRIRSAVPLHVAADPDSRLSPGCFPICTFDQPFTFAPVKKHSSIKRSDRTLCLVAMALAQESRPRRGAAGFPNPLQLPVRPGKFLDSQNLR